MKIALHGFGDRKTSLRNITVTVEESVARWARLEAARRNISVSRLLASILKDPDAGGGCLGESHAAALARKPFLKTDGLLFIARGAGCALWSSLVQMFSFVRSTRLLERDKRLRVCGGLNSGKAAGNASASRFAGVYV
jgi:hypothetical protein